MPSAEPEVARTFRRAWHVWLLLTLLVAATAMVSWMVRHPMPEGWDETRFVIRMHRDARIFSESGLVEGAKAMLVHYRMREPAFRLAALPVSLAVDGEPLTLRLWSMLQLLGAAGFLYQAGRLASGRIAGCVAAGMLLLSPTLRAVGMRVYTDPALYLAIGATLYFLVRLALERGRSPVTLVGLGVSLGFGALAKLTFGVVVAPVLLVLVLAALRGFMPRLDLGRLAGACLIGGILAAPWYLLNLTRWVGHALASNNPSWALEASGFLGKVGAWAAMAGSALLGPWVAAFVLLVGTAALWLWRQGDVEISSERGILVLAALAGAFALLCLHFLGQNHHSRLASPALLPLCLAVGIVFSRVRSARPRVATAIAGLLLVQSLLLVGTTIDGFSYRVEPWDWNRLREVVATEVQGTPTIAYLGLGTEFNMPQIEYPWAMRDEEVRVRQLFDFVYDAPDGELDWREIDRALEEVNVVVTIPDYPGAANSDNAFNGPFSDRLRANPRFRGPTVLRFGESSSEADVHVFFRSGEDG